MPADISGPEAQAPPVTTIMAMELARVLAMTQNGYVRALVLLCRPLGANVTPGRHALGRTSRALKSIGMGLCRGPSVLEEVFAARLPPRGSVL